MHIKYFFISCGNRTTQKHHKLAEGGLLVLASPPGWFLADFRGVWHFFSWAGWETTVARPTEDQFGKGWRLNSSKTSRDGQQAGFDILQDENNLKTFTTESESNVTCVWCPSVHSLTNPTLLPLGHNCP